MAGITNSSIQRVRSEIGELRRGLSELSFWMDTQRAYFPEVSNTCDRLVMLSNSLERLNEGLEQQEKERQQLEGLFEVSRTVNSTLDLNEVLNRAMDTIIQVTRAERGFLMLVDDATGDLLFQVARHMDRDTIARPAFQVSRSIIYQVAKTKTPVATTDALRDSRFCDQDSVISLSLRSILCIPLLVKERLIGVVYVDNRLHVGVFKTEDLEALRAFADQAAIAIDNARLFTNIHQKMEEIAALKILQDSIFASITSAVIATDLNDRVTAFNRAAENIFCRPRSETIGRHFEEVLSPLALTLLPQVVQAVKLTGAKQVATETKATIPNRGDADLVFSVSSLRDSEGNTQGVTIVVEDQTEKRQLEATRAIFRRYLSPAVVDRLPANPIDLKLGGLRQEITILFADIRGFTQFAETQPPDELVQVLNRYLAVAADAIFQQEGTLDKFMGDAVMAIFNAPLLQSDHSLRAVRAAFQMHSEVRRLHKLLPESLRLDFGIGIHTGDAVVGNVGALLQMNYTAIGDAVNLARRLQENARGGQIILSNHAYEIVRSHVEARRLPALKVKGRVQTAHVWELIGLRD